MAVDRACNYGQIAHKHSSWLKILSHCRCTPYFLTCSVAFTRFQILTCDRIYQELAHKCRLRQKAHNQTDATFVYMTHLPNILRILACNEQVVGLLLYGIKPWTQSAIETASTRLSEIMRNPTFSERDFYMMPYRRFITCQYRIWRWDLLSGFST